MKMYYYFFPFIFLFFCTTLNADFLTLGEALARIEKENLNVLLNRESIEQSLQKQYIERSALWPQVRADFTQKRQKDSIQGGQIETYNSMNAKLIGTMPLLDNGLYQSFKAAKLGAKVSQEAYQAILESILYETAKAYCIHARNIKRMDVLLKNIKRDNTFLEQAQIQLEAGTASSIDVARAKNKVLKDEQDILAQEAALYQSQIALKKILNWPDTLALEIDSNILDAISSQNFISSMDIQSIFKSRPDYNQGLQKIRQAKADLKKAKSGHLPKASLFAEGGPTGKTAWTKGRKNEWAIGAKVSLPLFEGYKVSSDILRAKSALREQRYAVRQLKNTIAKEYELAQGTLSLKRKQLELSLDQIQLAQEELDLAQSRFSNGVADNQELLLAQATLASVLDDEVSLLYYYTVGQLDILYIQGKFRFLKATLEPKQENLCN